MRKITISQNVLMTLMQTMCEKDFKGRFRRMEKDILKKLKDFDWGEKACEKKLKKEIGDYLETVDVEIKPWVVLKDKSIHK